ncbi:hypothetical protein CP97_01070 [Aurantiacibacter atlanticus]|uniref:SH3 domain-containing protein n=1 Tax=Aurantiacibacter atlanticus TaxID=1648404 RepID=A0A0H4V8X0_9SPHN|nr:hypothetical protein [Aurantiacibacter atlanticus]AKQ40940.1 hypothetical protein CP97_01070 [Aurantiacibacter atlanticus]MDF1834271.1 hypothetical protein [Alteraurantiacibacter sp. bin_em_oilr2.035]
MSRQLSTFIALPALSLLAMPAQAQDDQNPYAVCAQMEDDAARLACFDSTYAEQVVVIAEHEERVATEREEIFGFRERDDEIERAAAEEAAVSATVSEVLRGNRRSQVFLLDNGQLWREIDGSTLRNRVREGWQATVTRHWSGAYEMRFEGRSGYLRVARLR